MLISIIVAMAKNRTIGCRGQLPWHLPSDLRRFRELTMGHTLLMGRRTFESIGGSLPGRRTIVLSRDPEFQAEGCEVAEDIPAVLRLAADAGQLFVCGGEDVYRQTLPLTQRLYLTELEIEVEGDVFFPELPLREFETIHFERVDDRLNYNFSILQRREKLFPLSEGTKV